MRTYQYTGSERTKAVQRLAISLASMHQPTLVVRFGPEEPGDPLTLWGSVLPIEVIQIRLPGLHWPSSHTPADSVAVQTAMAVLAQVIASGAHRMVILDGINSLVAHDLLEPSELQRLAESVPSQTQIATT